MCSNPNDLVENGLFMNKSLYSYNKNVMMNNVLMEVFLIKK